MKTTHLEKQVCPYCGHILDAHSADEGFPAPGDISICFYCGGLNIFSNYLSLIKCKDEDLKSFDSETLEKIKEIQESIKFKNK